MSASTAVTAQTVHLLDCADVATWLNARGLKGLRGPLTPKAIRYWAAEGKIPMWAGPAGRLVITEAALNTWIAREQAQAQKACEEAPARRSGAKAARGRKTRRR
jgi:hypothetical protein